MLPQESTIQYIASCATILEAIVRHHNGMGLQTQSINQFVENKTINGNNVQSFGT